MFLIFIKILSVESVYVVMASRNVNPYDFERPVRDPRSSILSCKIRIYFKVKAFSSFDDESV